jgi:uncharacterized membrane protein
VKGGKMAKKRKIVKEEQQDDSKLYAFLATFFSILGFIIALATKKDNKYVMYYAKQSLTIFIIFVISWVVTMMPFLNWVGWLIYILAIILWFISWIYALSGEIKKIPIITELSKSINI